MRHSFSTGLVFALLAASGLSPAATGRTDAPGTVPPGRDSTGRPLPGASLTDGTGQPSPGAILIDDSGRPQWLAGCWPTAALRGRLDAYRGGSLHGLLEPLRPARLRYPAGPGEPPPWLDCDTASDLTAARAWARRPP